MKKNWLKDEEGFTLIEMVLVVLIIAALLLIFIPNIGKTRENAQTRTDAAVVKTVETQMEVYKLDKNTNSVTVDELVEENYIDAEQAKIYNQAN